MMTTTAKVIVSRGGYLVNHNLIGLSGICATLLQVNVEQKNYSDLRAEIKQEARTEEKNIRKGNPTTLVHKPCNSVYSSKLTRKLMKTIGA